MGIKDVFSSIDLTEHKRFLKESTMSGYKSASKKVGSILEFR